MTESADTLIAPPTDDGAESLTSLEGAGALSSWADLAKAVNEDDPDGMQIAFTAVGAGLDTLGAIADPFDEFVTSAVGWAIEHFSFLHEPLDALAGDPKQIIAQAQTWSNVAKELRTFAHTHAGAEIAGWDGVASVAYREAVEDYTGGLRGVAAKADELAKLVLGTGAAVGTVRALVRDLIAKFLIWACTRILAMAAMAGVWAPLVIADAVRQAVAMAHRIAERIARLLDALSEASGTAGQLVDGMRSAATELRLAAPYLQADAERLTNAVASVPAEQVVEMGKQFTGAKLDDREVRPNP